MTTDQQRAAIHKKIEDHTKAVTATKETARDSLIKEGVYNEAGRLTPEFGGKKKSSNI